MLDPACSGERSIELVKRCTRPRTSDPHDLVGGSTTYETRHLVCGRRKQEKKGSEIDPMDYFNNSPLFSWKEDHLYWSPTVDNFFDQIESVIESIESNALTLALKKMILRDLGSYRPQKKSI